MSRKGHKRAISTENAAANIRKPHDPVVDGANRTPWKWPWMLAAALVLLITTYATYTPAFDNGFVNWDDQDYVTECPLVLTRTLANDALIWRTPVSLNYHPLTMWSLAMDARSAPVIGKIIQAAPFIRTNVEIHLINTLLVFLFIWILSMRNLFVGFFCALIFGVHPMHVESVAWISERKDLLYALFFLLAAISYLRYVDTRKYPWLFASLLLFVLSCMSKAMAVSLAPVVLLLDLWRGRKSWSMKVIAEKIPFFLIALFFGLMALDVQSGGDFHGMLTLTSARIKATSDISAYSVIDRLKFAGYGYTQYLIRFFRPLGLCTFYEYPTDAEIAGLRAMEFWAGVVLLIGSSIAALWSLRKTRLFAFGTFFYLATVAMVLQFIPVGKVIMADRYTYIPYIGVSFMLLMPLSTLQERSSTLRYATWAGVGAFCLFLLLLARKQVDTWQDSETLWNKVIAEYPNAAQPRINLGNYYGKAGDMDKAIACYTHALMNGAKSSDVYEGLGNAYGSKGDHARAEEMLGRAIELDANNGSSYMNRGSSRMMLGKFALAIDDYTKAYELEGIDRQPMILSRRGYCQMRSGAYAQAVEDFTRSINGGYGDPAGFFYRAQAHALVGDSLAAIADLREALRRKPDFTDAQRALERIRGR